MTTSYLLFALFPEAFGFAFTDTFTTCFLAAGFIVVFFAAGFLAAPACLVTGLAACLIGAGV
jgi:hypothetical protein